jgi:hypothetical protein
MGMRTVWCFAAASLATMSLSGASATEIQELIAPESVWFYLEDLTNGRSGTPLEDYPVDLHGRAWNDPEFDIATSTPTIGTWKSGPTIIGGGILDFGEIQTEVPLIDGLEDGFSRITTILFRNSFNIDTHATSVSSLELSLFADDAGVLYLNGEEILRYNLPSGPLSTTSYAVGAGQESVFLEFTLPPSHLREGTNQLAFELHNSGDFSNDMGFAMSLRAVIPEPTPIVAFVPAILWCLFRLRHAPV